MCHLDAIDNAGRGVHNSSATMWKDLSGVAGDFGVTNGVATWTDNSLYKTRAGYMALNTVKCASMATLETAVSRLNSISGDMVIPFYHSSDRYFCIRDASSLRKIWFQNGNSRASSSLSDEATIAAVYASPVAVFQNGAEEATSSDYNTRLATFSDCRKRGRYDILSENVFVTIVMLARHATACAERKANRNEENSLFGSDDRRVRGVRGNLHLERCERWRLGDARQLARRRRGGDDGADLRRRH